MPEKKTTTEKKEEYIREPAVAGQFYEENPDKLKKMINTFLDKAEDIKVPGTLIGLVSPHAGYIYSGPVAAYSYKKLMGKKYKTVYVLAPSHRAYFSGVSVMPSGIYQTPLGDIRVDEESTEKLRSYNPDKISYYRQADEYEHSLEVQVPFLQVVLGDDWKIVPIVFGDNDLRTCSTVAEAIAHSYNPEDQMIIASTDMYHGDSYEKCVSTDKRTLEAVEKMDSLKLYESLKSGKCQLCGSGPVMTLVILTAALNGKAKVLKYANSADTAGSRDYIVGYGSVAFYTEEKIEVKKEETGEKTESETIGLETDKVQFSITEGQKRMLLAMSRKTLEEKVLHNKIPEFKEEDPLLEKELGLFVTLRTQPGDILRGCIGHCFPIKKLREALPELTVSSAMEDPRFRPVRKEELKKIKIEISLLSPMRRIKDWREIKIPGHGVYVRRGFQAGVFLPQVADETGWDRETFMEHLCRDKAMLPKDAWKEPETELYIFTVIKFEEKK